MGRIKKKEERGMTRILFHGSRFGITGFMFCIFIVSGMFLYSQRMKESMELKKWQKESTVFNHELERKNQQEINE